MSFTPRLVAAGVAGILLAAAGAAVPATAASAAGTAETRLVDRIATPKLRWYKCYGYAECATARVPLDYDHPHGTQTTLALLRVKATDQKHKIGSLFVNPGGPGGSATTLALAAPLFLSDALLARFDVVGMDPRGVGFSDAVKCFDSPGQQTTALKGMTPLFPYGAKQEKAYIASARKLGAACSSTGRPLSASMSTAEVARDMDVMRRAVGDKKLNYLGFSYGSALGEYYANMFPDRFRTLAVDGTINPVAWAGTARTKNQIQDDRLKSADGAYKALQEILKRCERAGSTRCEFAGKNVPQKFKTLTERLKKHPITEAGLGFTYADFIGLTLSALYLPQGGDLISVIAAALWTLTGASPAPAKAVALGKLRDRLGRDFPYDNSLDAYASVMCSDGLHPAKAADWPALAAKSDQRAPYFGRAWAWSSVQCAGDIWKAPDEDAYTGPFTKRTANTVLIVGSYWDPATNYQDAVKTSKLMPNSRLLSSDNWGHTAYGTSSCADKAIDQYLLYKDLPKKGLVCQGTDQPFTGALSPAVDLAGTATSASASASLHLATATKDEIAALGRPAPGTAKQRPPVAAGR